MMNNFAIKKVKARWVLDSRSTPTVEAEVHSGKGSGRAMVPSGASTGTHEALEMRDGTKEFHGKGVRNAVDNVNKKIAEHLEGIDSRNQEQVDRKMIELDGTDNKSKLGANAILAVSMANARCASSGLRKELFEYLAGMNKDDAKVLPVPMMNIINGGMHAGNGLAMQEFMILPSGMKNFSEALKAGAEIYHSLKGYLKEKHGKGAINVGDEGGFAPPISDTRQALGAIMKAIEISGYSSNEIKLGLDAAASSFFKEGLYHIDGKKISPEDMASFYGKLCEEYPIASIEDPMHEEDFDGFRKVTEAIGRKIQILGDDVFVTNVKRLSRGIEMKAANALLLKLNQVGTITEALDAFRMARKAGWNVAISHRSGETEDSFIADLAVGWNAGQIKTGAPARGERTAKYNQLLRIEEMLGKKALFGDTKL
ncbi:MAG: phosphopyruvate hydratase [Candidatus Aenigmarchaeota archaeon]|nr:phosphopyruvate hydratase [Candidatus Aenigmarchaeota archaeon]